jgi:hypothetical protein
VVADSKRERFGSVLSVGAVCRGGAPRDLMSNDGSILSSPGLATAGVWFGDDGAAVTCVAEPVIAVSRARSLFRL